MLQVFLLLNGLPQDPPAFAASLAALQQSIRFSLTVINNGQPFGPKRMFHQLGLTCRLLELPLRFHPAQILAARLAERPKADQFLWLEDRLIWHPAHLSAWLQELENWTWISPRLLPGQTLPQTRRSYQAEALLKPLQPARLQSLTPESFPPCFCFARSAIPVLREWLRPEGQLPLLMMAACDMATPAWHPQPALEPGQTEYALSLDEALARWQRIVEQRDTPERIQALLESLQRALPDSPAVYLRLAPMLPADAAVALLETALCRDLIYPELLALMAQALIACHQPELAAIYLRHLQQRFPGFTGQPSPWPQRGGTSVRLHPQALPQTARLSICLIVRDEAEALGRCLDSLRELAAEVILVDTGSVDQTQAVASQRGIQVLPFAWRGDFAAARNFALEQASGDWVLMLNADETLDPKGLPTLRRLLADPPPGLPAFQVPLLSHDASGRVLHLRHPVRLFPRHPLLRFRGRLFETLDCDGPVQIAVSALPGLPLIQHGEQRPQGLQRRLALLQELLALEPEQALWHYGLGECLAELNQPESALEAYQVALNSWLDAADHPLLPQAVIGALEALLRLARFDAGQALALSAEKACQDHPDYWYLRGQLQKQTCESEAVTAFERCLAFRGRSLNTDHSPDRIDRLPLLELMHLYRAQLLHPAQDLRRRQLLGQQLLSTLQQLLQVETAVDGTCLYLLLAETALASARLQRGPGGLRTSALGLYREYLPSAAASQSRSYYAETALLYLEGTPESLMDRLPPDYSYESVRELQLRPEALHAFCQELWQRPEVDGPLLASALLRITAQAHQDPSLWLMLCHLHNSHHEPQAAQQALRDACLHLPGNPYLLCRLAGEVLAREDLVQAGQLLNQALSLRPDLEEALHLQQVLTAKKRRKRYTELTSPSHMEAS